MDDLRYEVATGCQTFLPRGGEPAFIASEATGVKGRGRAAGLAAARSGA